MVRKSAVPKRILSQSPSNNESILAPKESRGSFKRNKINKINKKCRQSLRIRRSVDRYQSENRQRESISVTYKKPKSKILASKNAKSKNLPSTETKKISKKGKIGEIRKRKRALSATNEETKRVKKVKNESAGQKNPKKEPKDKVGKAKTSKKGPQLRPNLTFYKKDPTFESNTTLPFVSVSNFCKLSIRAALMEDENLLKKLILDKKRVNSLHVLRSVDLKIDAITYALIKNNSKFLKILLDDLRHPASNRVPVTKSLLAKQSSGVYNFHMLGHAVRRIEMSRGGREGTNAFLKDQEEFDSLPWKTRLEIALRHGANLPILRQLVIEGVLNEESVSLGELVVTAVRCGRRQLAGELARDYGAQNFNELHQQVLLNTGQPLKPFKAVSVKKKGLFNCSITPVHCAAINPNVKYIQELLAVDVDFNHGDSDDYRPIHYAAVNESSSVLKFLLEKGASAYDATKKKGATPLHLACEFNRPENVRILCEFLKKKSKKPEDDSELEDNGITCSLATILKQKSRFGLAAMHYAALEGNIEVIKVLRKYGAETDIRATASHNNATPLMIAAQKGHYALVEYLLTVEGAQLDAKDKLKRTAIMYATMNGHAHILSYLLRAGANVDVADSSGNTAVHYAAAYGWYFCLKLLIESCADLCKSNDWRLTTLSLAYMKGHMGLADLLLQQTNIDINCKDAQGMTLVTLTISSGVDETTPDQLDYLIKQKHADVNILDIQNNNALHHVAVTSVSLASRDTDLVAEVERRKSELRTAVAKILCEAGCSVNQKNDDSHTPLSQSVKTGSFDLALFLIRQALANLNMYGYDSSSGFDSPNFKVYFLHDLIKQCSNDNGELAYQIFEELLKINSLELKSFLQMTDSNGFTPFLLGCRVYKDSSTVKGRKNCRNLLKLFLILNPRIIEQKVKNLRTKNENEKNDNDAESTESDQDDDSFNGILSSENSERAKLDKKTDCLNGETAFHLLIGVQDLKTANNNSGGSSDEHTEPSTTLLSMLLQHSKDLSLTDLLEAEDSHGETALFRAAKQKDSASALKLIEFGANINFVYVKNKSKKAEKGGPDRISLPMAAILSKSFDLFAALIKRGADLKARDSVGDTALHYACRDPTLTRFVQLLLDANSIDLNQCNDQLRTPLHLICNADTSKTDASIETLEELLTHGANPFLQDCRGRLPLHYAFVKIGTHNKSSLLDPVAVLTALSRFMTSNPDSFNTADNFGATPLHYACKRGANISCVTMLSLCPQNLNINAKDKDGNTPFGLALYFSHSSCALTLFQAGADLWQPITVSNLVSQLPNFDQHYEQNLWVWAPVRKKYEGNKTYDTGSLVVRNEWQGMLYLIMHRLKQRQDDSSDLLIKAALEQRKYNLALTILRLLKADLSSSLASSALSLSSSTLGGSGGRKNLAQILADTAKDNVEPELQLKVFEVLCQEFSIDIDSHQPLRGPFHVSFYAAKRPNFNLLKHIETKSKPKFEKLVPTFEGHTVLTLLLENYCDWSQDRLNWLEKFIENHKLSLNLLTKFAIPIDFTKSTAGLTFSDDTGDNFDLSATTIGQNRLEEQITPLIRVIHMQNFPLAKLFLKLGADVNYADLSSRTPLMHAVRVNNLNLVKLLLNHDYEIPEEAPSKQEDEEDEDAKSTEGSEAEETGNEVKRLNWSAFHLQNKKARKSIADCKRTKFAKGNKDDDIFVKTSQADLHRKDNDGRTVVHHLVEPLPYGSWQNVEMLRIFARNGAQLDAKDELGQSPYRLAQKSGQSEMAAEFERLLKLTAKESINLEPFKVTDDAKMLGNLTIDVATDASKYLEGKINSINKEQEMKKIENAKRPHRLSGLAETGEIVVDISLSKPYSALMTKMDWTGKYGFYNFYRLQLIREKGRDIYVLFTNWGRMGDQGQYQKTSFRELSQAVKEFSSVFRAKTGNDWSNVKTDADFEIKPKKYRPILADTLNPEMKTIEIDLETSLESKLPKQLRYIMKDLANFDALNHAARSSLRRRYFNFPLVVSSLKRDLVLKSKEILEQIACNLEELQKIRDKFLTTDVAHHQSLTDEASSVYQKMMELSCEFYYLLPLKGFERSDIKIIDDQRMLKEYCLVVDNLLDFERANSTLCAAAFQRNSIHPFDYVFKSLKCNFQLLNPKNDETQYILHYIQNTSPDAKVKFVYKLYNEEKEKKFNQKNLANRRLLWHGTGAENLIGILTQGLMPAPFHAVQTGQMFGKGVYTADTFQKSRCYCREAASRTKYMLLCEVALGKCDEKFNSFGDDEKLKPNCDSVKGIGEDGPNPNYDVTLPTGSIIPLGDLTKTRKPKNVYYFSLHLNEYICFDPQQIIIRYLVAFKEPEKKKKRRKRP